MVQRPINAQDQRYSRCHQLLLIIPRPCSSRLPYGCQPLYNAPFADVAQLVEQHIRNVWVVSSNLIIGSTTMIQALRRLFHERPGSGWGPGHNQFWSNSGVANL